MLVTYIHNIIYFVIGLARGRWDSTPRMDPFLPCSSHHFESTLRPMVIARRSAQGSDRSTSSTTSGNSTTDTSSPPSPNEPRSFSRRASRPRPRYMPVSDEMISGIHPVLTWGRQRNDAVAHTPVTSAHNMRDLRVPEALAGQISNFFYIFFILLSPYFFLI